MRSRQLDVYDGPAFFVIAGERFDVGCHYRVMQEMVDVGRGEYAEGLIGWRGYFTTENPLMPAGAGTIELPDGRRGHILITEVNHGSRTGSFTGNGHAPA